MTSLPEFEIDVAFAKMGASVSGRAKFAAPRPFLSSSPVTLTLFPRFANMLSVIEAGSAPLF